MRHNHKRLAGDGSGSDRRCNCFSDAGHSAETGGRSPVDEDIGALTRGYERRSHAFAGAQESVEAGGRRLYRGRRVVVGRKVKEACEAVEAEVGCHCILDGKKT